MQALLSSYEETIQAVFDAKVDAIIAGAGPHFALPSFRPQNNTNTALIPIVSSTRALKIIIGKWLKYGYKPDAIIIEGPLAGGHLGFRIDELEKPENKLENLLIDALNFLYMNGYEKIPVIVAGGIYTHEDIVRFINLGASGVQIATRFLVTDESSAPDAYKRVIITATVDNIVVSSGSPCGMPFRTRRDSPALTIPRTPKCRWHYCRLPDSRDKTLKCKAENDPNFFCICEGLLASAECIENKPSLYTMGANAYRVNETTTVRELMRELTGNF
ncbi:MAG: 2-nitropropane dioxygenase [Candidatus Berkelbacteria bacterium Licking1014_85]|uniref:2-nitropropane dioxygenase n=1 Tax=Candidatus Berkelbacteria bacterium Licking1014_85 TaxID=2017148 RepID=A0A554LGE5_9BACT|nr:MAG: 2-nitropropane dioxygenase [Candidatus Berkelbacteria bacterium Licking1014_85]